MKAFKLLGIMLMSAILGVSSLTVQAAEFDDVRGSWALTADHDEGILYCPHFKVDSYVSTYTNSVGRTVNRYNIDQIGKCQLAVYELPGEIVSVSATTNAGYVDITEIETVSGYVEWPGFLGVTFQLTMDLDGEAMQGYYNDDVYPYIKVATLMKRVDY